MSVQTAKWVSLLWHLALRLITLYFVYWRLTCTLTCINSNGMQSQPELESRRYTPNRETGRKCTQSHWLDSTNWNVHSPERPKYCTCVYVRACVRACACACLRWMIISRSWNNSRRKTNEETRLTRFSQGSFFWSWISCCAQYTIWLQLTNQCTLSAKTWFHIQLVWEHLVLQKVEVDSECRLMYEHKWSVFGGSEGCICCHSLGMTQNAHTTNRNGTLRPKQPAFFWSGKPTGDHTHWFSEFP